MSKKILKWSGFVILIIVAVLAILVYIGSRSNSSKDSTAVKSVETTRVIRTKCGVLEKGQKNDPVEGINIEANFDSRVFDEQENPTNGVFDTVVTEYTTVPVVVQVHEPLPYGDLLIALSLFKREDKNKKTNLAMLNSETARFHSELVGIPKGFCGEIRQKILTPPITSREWEKWDTDRDDDIDDIFLSVSAYKLKPIEVLPSGSVTVDHGKMTGRWFSKYPSITIEKDIYERDLKILLNSKLLQDYEVGDEIFSRMNEYDIEELNLLKHSLRQGYEVPLHVAVSQCEWFRHYTKDSTDDVVCYWNDKNIFDEIMPTLPQIRTNVNDVKWYDWEL